MSFPTLDPGRQHSQIVFLLTEKKFTILQISIRRFSTIPRPSCRHNKKSEKEYQYFTDVNVVLGMGVCRYKSLSFVVIIPRLSQR